MFGIIFGTACLIGLFKVARAGRCGGYGYAGYGGHEFGGGCGGGWGRRMHGGWHGHHHHRGGGWGRMGSRGPLRYVFARLQTTPGQEKVISEEVEHVMQELQKVKG